ncbi:hypothetical protein M8C21_014583, partial [Ambrosia artemisiifolia]
GGSDPLHLLCRLVGFGGSEVRGGHRLRVTLELITDFVCVRVLSVGYGSFCSISLISISSFGSNCRYG